jgi:DNA repair exonuclease SbcCD ATPase subunit
MVATAKRPAKTDAPAVKIGRWAASNFMRLKSAECSLDGHSLVLSGPNGKGKSSFLLSVLYALGQVAKKEIPEPVLRGEARADIDLDLIDADTGEVVWCIHAKIEPDGEKTLTVKRPDGSKPDTSPQKLLDSFIDWLCLMPFEWLKARPQDQVDDVLRYCSVPIPVDAVAEITGERHEPEPGESAAQYLERLSADHKGIYYVRRTESGRVLEQKKHALQEHEQQLSAMPRLNGDGANVAELLKQRGELDHKREKARAIAEKVREAQADLDASLTKVHGLQGDRVQALQDASKIEEQIKLLHEQLTAKREQAKTLENRIDKGKLAIKELEDEVKALRSAQCDHPDPTSQILDIDRRIAAAEGSQKERARRAALDELTKRLDEDAREAMQVHSESELRLSRLRELRPNLLNGVDLGVSGLEIGDGELRHNGVPFKQASQAQKITVAFALAMRRNPRARFMLLDDAEHLDKHSRETLLALAERHGVQCLLTLVRDQEDLSFEVQE